MTTTYTIVSTPLGELLVAGTEHAVTRITNNADAFITAHPRLEQASSGSVVDKSARAIVSYLHGTIATLDVPCDTDGTAFQQRVWSELLRIPYGTTSSYTEIAHRIGNPKAFRAVANACGQNPIPIIIPCHRVVHKSGNVSGFAWGVETKRLLLDLEMANKTRAIAA